MPQRTGRFLRDATGLYNVLRTLAGSASGRFLRDATGLYDRCAPRLVS